MRTGHGHAHAAVGILNATATGIGCSLAVTGGVEAEWTWSDAPGVRFEGPCDDALARAVAARVAPQPGHGARVRTTSSFPPSRGLKTSSAAALALVRAARDAAGEGSNAQRDTEDAIAASLAAGVTLTGAFDDQVAVRDGGCALTDNPTRRVLARPQVPAWHVAVWVPRASIPKSALRGLDPTSLAPGLAPLPGLVRQGRIPEALTQSGAAFARLYASAGLPVVQEPADVALAAGALGAGLSGTGPAVAALFDAPAALPEVAGGAWAWVRAVAAAEAA